MLVRIEACLNDILNWMKCNLLKLNTDKTEVILFVSKKFANEVKDVSIKVGDSVIAPSTSVRNLGAILDSQMTMEEQVNSVSRSCFMQIRNIGKIRQYLTNDSTKSLMNSLVTSRLDYCNSLLIGTPRYILNKLQNVQNTAARLISRTPRFSHITPVLKELHWLPVEQRVEYKILTFVHKALHGQAPVYINSMLHVYTPTRQLCSVHDPCLLQVPRTKTSTCGDRSFVASAPRLWNALPISLRNSDSLPAFKRALKTHIFY